MTPQVHTFAHRALWLLPVWAALLFLSTLTHQPDPQTAFADFSDYVTTNVFLVSHLVGSIAGAAIGSIGVVGLLLYLQESKAARRLITGMAATVAGNTLLTAVFGVAAFAQPAMGRMFIAGEQNAIDFYNEVYAAPLFATAILGLLLFLIGGALSGMAIAASGRFPRWLGWAYAVATAGFVVSFIVWPVGMSVFSGLFIVATAVLAWSAAREGQRQYASAAVAPES
ncbi:MAG TPA: hypothetical protein VF177_04880 [Anaerolineae bacterium]